MLQDKQPLLRQEFASTQAVGLVYDPMYLLHDAGPVPWGPPGFEWPFEGHAVHWETPQRIARVMELVHKGGLAKILVPLTAREATIQEICAVHTREYADKVAALDSDGGGDAGEGAWVSPGSFQIARLAAGGCLTAVDEVLLRSHVRAAYALIRPPGHHAMPNFGMGYCIFNNIAIAARYALEAGKLARVAIVDLDVHHGNGTQAAFWDDPQVLFISIHQEDLFPVNSGAVDETGGENARGLNVNIPLPAGSGEAAYQLAFDLVVAPMIKRYVPELILVSAGQDASFNEAIGRMCLSTGSFFRLTSQLRTLADQVCAGRLVFVQEGGYNLIFMPFAALAVIEALCGQRSTIQEPVQQWVDGLPSNRKVSLDQVAMLNAVRRQHDLE